MFHLSYTTPYKGPIETLRFKTDPRRRGLGIYKDVEGVEWDVYAIMGQHINARKVAEHPRYYGTAVGDNSNGSHEWIPYAVEVVDG